jgi:hypothetical protein
MRPMSWKSGSTMPGSLQTSMFRETCSIFENFSSY